MLTPHQKNAIPDYLKTRPQWVMWKFEKRKDKNGNEKLTKVPYQVNGQHAKSNVPATWNEFDACCRAFAAGGFDGIGFCFAKGDGLTGIDLDHCVGTDGKPESWAQEVLDKFYPTYIEWSPSREGFHIWCLGAPLKIGYEKWTRPSDGVEQGIEVYNFTSARYFTVTGQVYESVKDQ